MQNSTEAVEAAFQSCKNWFPLVGRLQIVTSPPAEHWMWQPDGETWQSAASIIGQLTSMHSDHSQTIRDSVYWGQEFSKLPESRIQFGTKAHFSGVYGKVWKSAALAVTDEVERLLNEILLAFDPLCDLKTTEGSTRAIQIVSNSKPTEAQMTAVRWAVSQFCIQCDIPRVCSELRQQIEAESAATLEHPTSGDLFTPAASPSFSGCGTWAHLYEFLWAKGIRLRHRKQDILPVFAEYRAEFASRKTGTGRNKKPRYDMPSNDDAKSVLQNYKKQLRAEGITG